VELELSKVDCEDREPYEELLGDALAGDTFRFAREDYVEEAWRIVDPAIGAGTPIHVYEPGTWGPKEAHALVPGGWFTARD
jgi:glucose-6-phosphate 1-dehydrogenase